MDFTELFTRFWWLIFPIGGMAMGFYGMVSHHRQRSETLRLLKSYADQGKEPPQFLIDALKSDEQRAFDHAHGRGSLRRHHGPWFQVVIFSALAVGFGYYGYYGEHDNAPVFMALALGFGVAAAVLFVLGIIGALTRPRFREDGRDRIDD